MKLLMNSLKKTSTGREFVGCYRIIQLLNETVTMVNESSGNCSDAYALELACSASVPDEVISVLVQTSCQLSY